MFGPRGAEQLGIYRHHITIVTIYRDELFCVGEMIALIELLFPGWLAGIMLACAAGRWVRL